MAVAAAAMQRPRPLPQLSIRQTRPAPRPPPNFEQEAWAKLQGAVRAVFGKRPPPGGSQEEVFRLVEAMCLVGLEAKLAAQLEEECGACTAALLADLPAVASRAAREGGGGAVTGATAALLRLVSEKWEDHCAALRRLALLFLHLDRTYILQRGRAGRGEGSSLWERGLVLFRVALAEVPEVQEQVLVGLLALVDEDRRGAAGESRALLKNLSSMLSHLGAYRGALEPRLLEHAAAYYRREAEDLMPRLPAADYLLHCERRLEEEQSRCRECFEADSCGGLLSRVREELLKRPAERLLEMGFPGLVEAHCLGDLSRLYTLLGEVDELQALRRAWAQAIKRRGLAIMAAADVPEESRGVVPALMDLRSRSCEVLGQAFENSSSFSIAMRDAFQEFLNAGVQNLPAKLLARHVDEFLRNERAAGDADLEQAIERVVGLFRYISAKDAFEAFFKKDLAKRLLAPQRASSDHGEQLMLQRLRDECGAGYTSKIEGMVRDIDNSKSTQAAFLLEPDVRAALDGAGGLELGVLVLTSGLWPDQPPSPDVAYPPVASSLQDMYTAFYASRHTGRSLRWSPQLGLCTLRAAYEGGVRKELVVSHFQALVLLLFNSADRLTCAAIAAATRVPQGELQRTLQSLALHKAVKPLLREGRGREVDAEDVFIYNAGFTHKLYHILVPQIPVKEAHEEEAGVEQRLFEDRQHETDAAIVRIMKARKTLAHQQLVAEVSAAVKFQAAPSDIKRRIESLIEKEYLERDAAKPSVYNYLA